MQKGNGILAWAGLRHAGSRLILGLVVLMTAAPAPAWSATPAPSASPNAGTSCQQGLLGASAPTRRTCPTSQAQVTPALPSGFAESIVWSNIVNPTNIEFAADGRVFVATKSGVIDVFDNTSDQTPTVFSDLTTNVQDYWDRGLLGMALDPSLTGGPNGHGSYLYVLYTYDHILGSSTPAPQWGDTCPTPPGPTTDGCVVSGRLSRFNVSGTTITGPEQVLIEDWCQQYPSHSIGNLAFGADGALYVSGGDGASFAGVDYGQRGGTTGTPPPTPLNPCGDPPGGAMTLPTAEGGALRSQDLRTEVPASTGLTYAQTVLADGPVAYWRLGEASGTTAADSAGSNTGSYVGAPVLGAPGALSGDSNTSLTLDGVNDAVTVPDAAALHLGNGPWSLEFWYKRASLSTNGYLLAKGGATAWPYLDYDGMVYVTVAGSGDAVRAAGPRDVGLWHHLVITKTSANVWKVYIDGVDKTVPMASFTTATNTSPITIGGTGWKGNIDELAVYPTALSAAQVQAHYNAAIAASDPTSLDGAILRVDPMTGAGFAGNPYASSQDPNKRRIIAYGFRNPFRFRLRPGTNEMYVGDVGSDIWEEIDQIPNVGDSVVEDFGWPCYEGVPRNPGYDDLGVNICEDLYAAGPTAVSQPFFAYAHGTPVAPNEVTCTDVGSSISGMAFYPDTGGSFPAQYRGGLFFADHTRNCIWYLPKGANGQIDPTKPTVFLDPATNPVDLEIGPDGALYYADFDGNTIRKVAFSSGNQPPHAVIQANPTNGPAPLTVNFTGSGSSDPDPGDTLSYAWDLDGDGQFDDSTTANPTWTYQTQQNVTVKLRVTDPGGLTDVASVVIAAGNTPPVPTIATPVAGTLYGVGQVIGFSGSATDQQDGTEPASRLSWQLQIKHCPTPDSCHLHDVQTWTGVASGTFAGPDHLYPSGLILTLTATDSNGLSASVTRLLDPRTVTLTFQSVPSGLQLVVDGTASTTPFTRTVIESSVNSITATSPQTLGGTTYSFSSWSDGHPATHDVTAPTNATYTATFATGGLTYAQTVLADGPVAYWRLGEASGTTAADSAGSNTGSYVGAPVLGAPGALSGDSNTSLTLDGVNDAVTVPDAAALHLGNGPWSLEFWYKRASLSTNGYLLAKGGATAWPYLDYDGMVYVTVAGSGDAVRAAGPRDVGLWHHLVITKTSANVWKVYIDGVDKTVPMASFTTATNTSPITIGGTGWKGNIDELAVYPTALSAAQVQAHYNVGRNGP